MPGVPVAIQRINPFATDPRKTAPGFAPLVFKAEEKKTAFLCQCKHTKNPPYCDGTHKSL